MNVSPVRPPRIKTLQPARVLFQAALERAGFRPSDYPLFELWDRLLGREADKARAMGVKNRRLFVDVDNSVRLHGLTLRKRELLKKLNGAFGGSAPLSDIIFRLGTASPIDDKHG